METGVFYPGQRGFTPDIIIVMDVALHHRYSWVVSREGRGIDVIIEVHSRGDWRKDYVDNVTRYAELGVPEYFIFDVGRKTLTAYRLVRGERRYEPIPRRLGGYRSEVLGLDLRIRKGSLRFVHNGTVLSTPAEWIGELQEIAEQEQARAEEEQAQAERERAQAERERARADQEQARADQALADAAALIRQIQEQLRSTLRQVLEWRKLAPVSEEQRAETEAMISACGDPVRLQLWVERAWQVADLAAVFRDS